MLFSSPTSSDGHSTASLQPKPKAAALTGPGDLMGKLCASKLTLRTRLLERQTTGLLTKLLSCRLRKFGLKSSFEPTFRGVGICSETAPLKIHCKEQSGMGRGYEFDRGEDPLNQILLDP